MDTYVSALLGLPQLLSNDDVDQELPLEVDDEYITKDGILPMPPGTTSLYAASNAHTGLMDILSKVVTYIYPTKGNIEPSTQGTTTAPYMISHRKIREIERDLAEWLDKLPLALRPGGEGSAEVLRWVFLFLISEYIYVKKTMKLGWPCVIHLDIYARLDLQSIVTGCNEDIDLL